MVIITTTICLAVLRASHACDGHQTTSPPLEIIGANDSPPDVVISHWIFTFPFVIQYLNPRNISHKRFIILSLIYEYR